MKKIGLYATFLFTAFALSSAASEASAQLPGIGVRLVPKAGMYRPLGDLVDGFRINNKLALGLGAELQLPLIPIGVRANLDYTPATDIEDDAGSRAGTVSITNLVGDLMFKPLPGIIPVQPYLFVGGGVKKYKVREFTTAVFGSEDNSTDPTLHAGAGVSLGIGAMGLVIEGGDYLSRFKRAGDSKLQNDLYATVGVKVGLF
jgi:hypothetical protein